MLLVEILLKSKVIHALSQRLTCLIFNDKPEREVFEKRRSRGLADFALWMEKTTDATTELFSKRFRKIFSATLLWIQLLDFKPNATGSFESLKIGQIGIHLETCRRVQSGFDHFIVTADQKARHRHFGLPRIF